MASGECNTSTGSNLKDTLPSKSRSPGPSRTGAMSSVSSSMTPATSACRTVEAPPAMSTPSVSSRLACLRMGRVEVVGDEVKGRAALHLDGFAGVMAEHEHGCSRLWSSPATNPSSEIDMWQVVSGIHDPFEFDDDLRLRARNLPEGEREG